MAAVITFGPNDSYFFNSATQWTRSGLPAEINALFTSQPPIKEVYELAVGPEGSFVISYLDAKGVKYVYRQGIPAALDKWLVPVAGKPVARDIPSLNISLGPNGSYFAFDKNGSVWGGLPKGFNDALAGHRDAKGRFKSNHFPTSVSLGYDGTYVFLNQGGGGSWNLKGQNDELNSFLHDCKSLSGMAIVLSPSTPGRYALALSNGNSYAYIPESWHANFEKFQADWRKMCQPATGSRSSARPPTGRHHSTAGLLGKAIAKGIIGGLIAANSNNSNGGGGGGQFFDPSGGNSGAGAFDMSSFWAPIQSAASDPIQ